MKTYRIATIPGDGIGKEVVPAGQQVLEALAAAEGRFAFEFQNFGWGGDWYRAHGEMMPADGLEALKAKGLIQGASPVNAVVLTDTGLVAGTTLRWPDEFVRHKILDVIGDFSLLGRPLRGRIRARATGHRHNVAMVRQLIAAAS
ncbi:UDP-3-O-acyl-N-acetylglucosamine deacetylase [Piscinibacter sp.]|uniref:UDP-3-O-acyl-N-acetylglucosamine deacetylase n=1 Tax=Piscinibacter sp. TaxID=1903157 RepID=UPI003784E148